VDEEATRAAIVLIAARANRDLLALRRSPVESSKGVPDKRTTFVSPSTKIFLT
jgi:hypothetical protein